MDDLHEPLSHRLRALSRSHHAQAQHLPFFEALADGTLEAGSYVAQLRALSVVHGVVEHELSHAPSDLGPVLRAYRPRLPDLLHDLSCFEVLDHGDDPAVTSAALGVANDTLLRSARAPRELLALLYVLEGSINGTRMLRPRYEEVLGLRGRGCTSYLDGHGEASRTCWARFTEAVDQVGADLDESCRAAMVEACDEAFQGIIGLYRALHPPASRGGAHHVTALNPEAGSHAIPQDPREIKAAVVAARVCWQRFPYLAVRYGERGWRFTLSDSAWLATLIGHRESVVRAQVEWLSSVLAPRGLPRIIMEVHLEVLHEALAEAVPDRREACGVLLDAARALRHAREAAVPPDVERAVADDFARQARTDEEAWRKGVGGLLVSAVADEAAGLEGTVEALVSWLTDPVRSDEEWASRVRRVVARACARPS